MKYTNQTSINTIERVEFDDNLGDVHLKSIATTNRVKVGKGTNLVVEGNIFCKSLVSRGKVKASAIICAEECIVKEYEVEYVSAFRINGQFLERKSAPSSSPLYVSVEQLAEQKERSR